MKKLYWDLTTRLDAKLVEIRAICKPIEDERIYCYEQHNLTDSGVFMPPEVNRLWQEYDEILLLLQLICSRCQNPS